MNYLFAFIPRLKSWAFPLTDRKVAPNLVADALNPGEYFYIGNQFDGDVAYVSKGDEYEGDIPNIMESTFKNEKSELYNQLKALIPKFAEAAQSIYDEWDATADPEVGDWEVGFGGICHLIADKMVDALSNNPNMWAATNATDYAGSPHVNLLVFSKDNTEGYIVDIDPFRYEKGGGYNWKKIPDVKFDNMDVSIYRIDPENFLDENGDLIEY